MPPTTSLAIRNEVEFRISYRLNGAATVGNYINEGLNRIEFAAPYIWDMVQGTATPNSSGQLQMSSSGIVDIGKPILFNFNDTKMAIPRRRPDQAWASPDGSTPLTYQSWDLFASGSSPAVAQFRPAINPGILLDWVYHVLPTPLDGTAGTSVPWYDPWMDDLLCDITESIIKRILSMAGWQELEARSQQLLVEAVKRYSSGGENPGLLEYASRPAKKE